MQSGDIFKVDDDAITEMERQEYSVIWKDKAKNEHRLPVSTSFRITRDGLLGLPAEVRASKINPETGKCGRGRPRRFPAEVVYRLLGEDVPDPATFVAPQAQAKPSDQPKVEVNGNEITVSALADTQEDEAKAQEDAKEKEERRAHVQALLGNVSDDTTDASW